MCDTQRYSIIHGKDTYLSAMASRQKAQISYFQKKSTKLAFFFKKSLEVHKKAVPLHSQNGTIPFVL